MSDKTAAELKSLACVRFAITLENPNMARPSWADKGDFKVYYLYIERRVRGRESSHGSGQLKFKN